MSEQNFQISGQDIIDRLISITSSVAVLDSNIKNLIKQADDLQRYTHENVHKLLAGNSSLINDISLIKRAQEGASKIKIGIMTGVGVLIIGGMFLGFWEMIKPYIINPPFTH